MSMKSDSITHDFREAATSPAEAGAIDLLAALLASCSEVKYSFNRDGTLKALRAVFKPSVMNSIRFQDEVRKAIRSLHDERLAALPVAKQYGSGQ
jgi:hypothetical protein